MSAINTQPYLVLDLLNEKLCAKYRVFSNLSTAESALIDSIGRESLRYCIRISVAEDFRLRTAVYINWGILENEPNALLIENACMVIDINNDQDPLETFSFKELIEAAHHQSTSMEGLFVLDCINGHLTSKMQSAFRSCVLCREKSLAIEEKLKQQRIQALTARRKRLEKMLYTFVKVSGSISVATGIFAYGCFKWFCADLDPSDVKCANPGQKTLVITLAVSSASILLGTAKAVGQYR